MDNQDPRKGNAFVNAEDHQEPAKEKKDLKTFTGVGAVKKTPKSGVRKWIREVFLSGRSWKEIWLDLRKNRIEPDVKDLIFNCIVDALSSRLYSDGRGNIPTSTSLPSGNFITRYIDYAAASTGSQTVKTNESTKTNLAINQKKEEEAMKSGFELPTFPDYRSAKQFLDSMKAEISKYDELSVYDISWKRGKTINFTWNAWGWSKNEILAIKEPSRFRQPVIAVDGRGNKIKMTHYIDLPPIHELEG